MARTASKPVSRAKPQRPTQLRAPEGLDMSVIEDNIGHQLRVGMMSFFRSLDRVLAPFELRPSLFATLVVIEANPDRKQQEIGEAVGIKRPNFVVVIDELEKRGLVRRHRAAGDARSYALRLTPGGAIAMREIRAAHDAHENAALASMGEDREAFFRALGRLRAFSQSSD